MYVLATYQPVLIIHIRLQKVNGKFYFCDFVQIGSIYLVKMMRAPSEAPKTHTSKVHPTCPLTAAIFLYFCII